MDTNQELVLYMPAACHICKAEGFHALTRVRVNWDGKSIFAAINVLRNDWLAVGEAGLSEAAAHKLEITEGELLEISHAEPIESMAFVRKKLYGHPLMQEEYQAIVSDIADEKYSAVLLAGFIASCSGKNMSIDEISYLTKAMINCGTRLQWQDQMIADKHCIGGLPGNRTTLIVVPVVASLGILMPKTSSKAITSPAGTADTMSVLTNVDLNLRRLRSVVEQENGCIAWGGALGLSPADDVIIRVERALDLDSEGQMIASILSKKAAAGATHCIIDIPVGRTAKIRTLPEAIALSEQLKAVSSLIGINTRTIFSDGCQPVGRGIGPSLEARDVLSVLQNQSCAPADLRSRSLTIASEIISLVKKINKDEAMILAEQQLNSGEAFAKLIRIAEAQGGFKVPGEAKFIKTVEASSGGTVNQINNRKLAQLAKLAGAPDSPEAGVDLHVRLEDQIVKGEPLFSLHANSKGELEYALNYYYQNMNELLKITSYE